MYDEWLTADDRLTHFRKARKQILGRVKGSEFASIQGHKPSEEDIVIMERVPIRNERPSVRETVTNGNHAPIGQE